MKSYQGILKQKLIQPLFRRALVDTLPRSEGSSFVLFSRDIVAALLPFFLSSLQTLSFFPFLSFPSERLELETLEPIPHSILQSPRGLQSAVAKLKFNLRYIWASIQPDLRRTVFTFYRGITPGTSSYTTSGYSVTIANQSI